MMSKIVHDTCTYKTDLSLIFIIIFDVNIFINFVEKIWGGGQTFWPHPTFFKNEITSNIAMQIQLQADIHTFFYKQLDSGVRAQLLKNHISLRARNCLAVA